VNNLFACQEAKTDFQLVWFAESHNIVVESLSSNDHLSYYVGKKPILYLPSKDRSPSGASSKNSKPEYEANAISSANGTKDKKKKTGSSSSSNLGGKGCNWYCKHSAGTASSHIWIACNELKVRSDRNGAEMGAPSRKSITL
jgi:hypothetical protein